MVYSNTNLWSNPYGLIDQKFQDKYKLLDNIYNTLIISREAVTINNLRGLEPNYDNQVITLVGHTVAGQGGGYFISDFSDTTTVDDNGLTIVTAGGKRWKRVIKGNITVEDFGAIGDEITDDSAAFQSALETGMYVEGNVNKTYLLGSTLNFVDKNVFFNGNKCKIKLSGDVGFLNAEAVITNVSDVISVDLTTGSDLSNGTVGSETLTTEITLADATGYNIEDIVKIVAEDTIVGEDPGDKKKNGEFSYIAGIVHATESSNAVITLYSRLRYNYTTGIRIGKVNQTNKLKLENYTVIGQTNPDPEWNTIVTDIISYVSPIIKNVKYKNLVQRAVRFVSCLRHRTKNLRGINIRTAFDDNAFGYVVHEVACEAGIHDGLYGFRCRHTYATSAASVTNDDLSRYGTTVFSIINDGYAKHTDSSGWDTHGDAEDITFNNCISDHITSGRHGLNLGFGIRGRRITLNNCIVYGGSGYRSFSDYDNINNSRDHVYNNCKWITDVNISQDTYSNDFRGYAIVGTANNVIKNIVYNDCHVIQNSGDVPSFELFYGEAVVNNLRVLSKFTGTATARVFELNDNTCVLKVKKSNIDFTGATGTGNKLFNIINGNVDVSDIEIIADGKLHTLVDFNNNTGTFIGKNINTTHAPTVETDGLVNENNATCYVDWVENDGRTGTLSHFGGGSFDGNTATLNIGKRYGKHLYARVLVVNNDGTIDNISVGNKLGQKITIYCRSDSNNNLIIVGNGTNIDIGSNETILPGKSLTFMWANSDGTNNKWIKVS